MFRLLARYSAAVLSVLLALGSMRSVSAQTEPTPQPEKAPQPAEMTSIAEVNRALTDPAAIAARDLTFRGVVAFVSHIGDLCVLDGGTGVVVEPPGDGPRPALGDVVEVTAAVKFQTADATDPGLFLKAQSLRRIGPGELPKPEKPWLAEALNGKCHMRWVEVEGVVMQSMMEHGVLFLHLTDKSGWAVVTVHQWREGDEFLRQGWGARLRIRCPNVGRGHRALRVSSSGQITVLEPGVSGLFAAPVVSAATLAGCKVSESRMHLAGTVLAVQDGAVYLRDGDTAFRCTLLAPFSSTSSPPHPLELLPPKTPDMKPGDRVEAVGSPLKTKPWLELSFAAFRLQSSGEAPPPRQIEGSALLTSAVCDRVKIRAEFHSRKEAPGRNGITETLTLDAGGTVLEAMLDSAQGGQLTDLRAGDILDLTGVVLPPSDASARLFLTEHPERGQRAVAMIKRNLSPIAIKTIGILTGGLLLALGAAWWLQRQVRLRTAALAAANASLTAETATLQQTRAELARSLDQERELGDLKSRFVSMVSHEFRTPLGITMSAVELLQHYEGRLEPEQKAELLGDIQRSTRHMAELMEEVLLLGRVEAGKVGCRPLPIDFDALARKLADESLSATNRRCPIHWAAATDLSGAVGDEALLRHIFSNLITNAVKYSPADSPVDFQASREGQELVATVKDSGIGIPAEDVPRLFEAFHRCSNVGDTPGTGLGLVIVRRCIDLHGGTIHLDSAPGRGTTWTVRLPLWKEN